MTPPTIIYFDIRARAEPIRLILEETKIRYVDEQITDEEWSKLRPNTPFGWLPAYRDRNFEIWQSHAIYRHLARVHRLYGSAEGERIRCDVVEEAFADLNTLVGRAPWRPSFDKKREEFIELELSPLLGRLERFLEENPLGTSFWVGSSLTYVYALIVPLTTTSEGRHMPAEKEIGGYDGKFTSIRVCEINGEERVIEGTYEIRVSGELSGTATGTMTFTGLNERGTFSDLGVGYLDSGAVLSAKGQGVYWSGSKGQWETRGAYMLGDQMIVGEGQITMEDGIFAVKGTIRELT